MLSDEIRALTAPRKALRSFGWSVGLVLLGIAAVVLWQNAWLPGTVVYSLGGLGGALVIGGLLLPGVLKPLYFAWMTLALILGFIMTRVLLTVVYYLVLTPIGLLRRMFGQDPMARTMHPEQESYWIAKDYHDPSPKRLERYY